MTNKPIKIIKRDARVQRDDPDWPLIERNIRSIRIFIEQRPERAQRIRRELNVVLDAKVT